MRANVILADSAQVADGKLYLLGGGWSMTGPGPVPSAVAVLVHVESFEFGAEHHWELFLEDADGKPVLVPGPDGAMVPVEVRGDFAIAPQGDAMPSWDASVNVPIAINVGPLALAPDSRYVWRIFVNGEQIEGGLSSFVTRPAEVGESI